MLEIVLQNLNSENFYFKTLQTIESICDDRKLENYFGIFSMFNQTIFDFLISGNNQFNSDVTFHIFEDEISLEYNVDKCDFSSINNSDSDIDSPNFIISNLADSLEFSPDNKTLTATFHVKTNRTVNRIISNTITNNITKNA